MSNKDGKAEANQNEEGKEVENDKAGEKVKAEEEGAEVPLIQKSV